MAHHTQADEARAISSYSDAHTVWSRAERHRRWGTYHTNYNCRCPGGRSAHPRRPALCWARSAARHRLPRASLSRHANRWSAVGSCGASPRARTIARHANPGRHRRRHAGPRHVHPLHPHAEGESVVGARNSAWPCFIQRTVDAERGRLLWCQPPCSYHREACQPGSPSSSSRRSAACPSWRSTPLQVTVNTGVSIPHSRSTLTGAVLATIPGGPAETSRRSCPTCRRRGRLGHPSVVVKSGFGLATMPCHSEQEERECDDLSGVGWWHWPSARVRCVWRRVRVRRRVSAAQLEPARRRRGDGGANN